MSSSHRHQKPSKQARRRRQPIGQGQMNILLMAPQPFYQERGTPIAIDLLLRVACQRGDYVDVLTYHEGRGVYYPNLVIFRIPNLPFVRNIRPGFSWKKLVCDVFMLFKALQLVQKRQYDYIHAVEESVFIALLFKLLFKIPYLYDMDSSLAQQMVEKYGWLQPLAKIMGFFEGLAVKHAEAVIPVCDRLADDIQQYQPKRVFILPDVSLVS